MKIEQAKNNLRPKLFPKDVKTRWWSTFKVVEFFVENIKAIEACLGNNEMFKRKKDKILISTETFATAYALNVVCKPLADASIEFERENAPTISIILPFLHQMETFLQKESVSRIALKVAAILELEGDDETMLVEGYVESVIDLVQHQLRELNTTYRSRFLDTLEKATYLDPR